MASRKPRKRDNWSIYDTLLPDVHARIRRGDIPTAEQLADVLAAVAAQRLSHVPAAFRNPITRKSESPKQSQKIARLPPDFLREGSVSRAMKREVAEAAVTACIELISSAVGEADAAAKAARQCADAGQSERAFKIALEIEPLLCEANSLLQVAAVIRRQIDPP